MRTSFFRWTLATAWLLTVLPVPAQDDVSPADAQPAKAASGPGETQPNPPGGGTESVTVILGSSALDKAIDQLPAGLRELAPLETLRQQVYASTTRDRRPLLWDAARDILGRITTETPQNQLEPLVNVAAQLAAQLYLVSQTQADQDWGSKALEVLSQLEELLAKDFPTRLELAATVGLERIKIQVIPKPGGSVDDYWVKAPAGLNAFLERYPNTIAAAQAAWLMGDACETAMKSPAGLPTPAVGQFPEPTFLWYHAAIKQAPDSLWGKLARGCLNRLDLVGQTLEVSGTSLVGKPLSLESFRGKPTVVVFFRPGKSSWGTAENGGDFAAAVRSRGFEVLGVLCHSPTAAPDEIDRIAKPRVPPEEEPADRMPVIEDAVDVDASNSVRFGITAPRLFVRVDESGKVVRTALTEIKDLDEFLGLAAKSLAADATSPADATLAEQPSTARSAETPDSPTLSNAAQEPSLMAFRVKHGLAAEYVKLAQVMFPVTRMSADDRSNSIVIYGTLSELEKVEALMLALDKAATVSSSKPPSQPPETAKAKPELPGNSFPDIASSIDPLPRQHIEIYVFTDSVSKPSRDMLDIVKPLMAEAEHRKLKIELVDVDRQPDQAKRFQVDSVPTIVVVADGREAHRQVGALSAERAKEIMTRTEWSPGDTTSSSSAPRTDDYPFQVTSDNLLVMETPDGLAAYSTTLGVWDRIVVDPPKEGGYRMAKCTVGSGLAFYSGFHSLCGFSSDTGKWSKLDIPPAFQGKYTAVHRGDMITVQLGSSTYALSKKAVGWTSSDGTRVPLQAPGKDLNGPRTAPTRVTSATPGLPNPRLGSLESRAAELAHNVRELTKTHGSEHPALIAARQQLEQTLTEALELKFRSEQRQVATLEQRLTRLKSQLDQRKAVQSQIVERRMRELLETPATRWNTDESSSDSSTGNSLTRQATDAASSNPQPAVQDQITVDLYATDPIYQNQQLIGAVVAPLNKLKNVIANIRIVPGDSGKFVFAIVHDPSQRIHRETQQTGKESATRQAISAALKAGGINDVRWEGAVDFVPSKVELPTEGEAAPGAVTMSNPNSPLTREPADSLESSARLTLELEEAQADVRETEQKLTLQVKLHAEGAITLAELTDVLLQRDRAVRRRQVLLDEYAATVKDLELQLSAASLENDFAVLDHRRLIQLVEQNAVPLKEAQDAALRAVRSAHTLERLKNRLEFLKKSGEGSAVKEPPPSNPPGETSDLLRAPSQPPQPAATPVP